LSVAAMLTDDDTPTTSAAAEAEGKRLVSVMVQERGFPTRIAD